MTTDGGTSWTTDAPPTGYWFAGISCPAPGACLISGDYDDDGQPQGVFFDTTNGGASWQGTPALPGRYALSGVSCTSTTACFAAGTATTAPGGGVVIVTGIDTNGAGVDRVPFVKSEALGAISCPTAGTCFAVGSHYKRNAYLASVFTTTNGGATWTSQTPPRGTLEPVGISCSSTTRCVSVTETGIIGTTDGGKHWRVQPLPTSPGWFSGITCPTSTMCNAVGGMTALATTDSGVRWNAQMLQAPSGTNFHNVVCPTSSDCFAQGFYLDAGSNFQGVIDTTTDGGASWSRLSLPSGQGYEGLACSSALDCVAVGGAILTTTDGGARWGVDALPSGVLDLYGVACPTQAVCYAAGRTSSGAAFLESDDSGATWSPESVPAGIDSLNGINCFSTTRCDAVSYDESTAGGSLYATANGGANWSPVSVPDNIVITGLACPSSLECVATGYHYIPGTNDDSADALTSFDGGSTWKPQPLPAGLATFGYLTVAMTNSLACPTSSHCVAVGAGAGDVGGVILDYGSTGSSPLTISTTSLPHGTTQQPYTASLAAAGGIPPYQWSLASGSLPPGVSLSKAGLFSGVPTAPGTYFFTVRVKSAGEKTTATLQLRVREKPS